METQSKLLKAKLNFVMLFSIVMLFWKIDVSGQSCTGNINITATDNLSSTWGTNFTNTTVSIQDDFIIDAPFTFAGCDVNVYPGKKIIVMAGQTLTITSGTGVSHLYACTDMWDGITIEGDMASGSGILYVDDYSIIEHAYNAVYIPDASKGLYFIDYSIFNRNLNHILIDYQTPNVYALLYPIVENSLFTCEDLSNPGVYTNLISPLTSVRTSEAISFNIVGGPNQNHIVVGKTNEIRNADIGVYSFNSHTRVENCKIYDCNIGYYGIFDGRMVTEECEIYNCDIGIESTDHLVQFEVYSSNIHDISNRGIYVHFNTADINIKDNLMREMPDAIIINDNSGDNHLISGNTIENSTVQTFPSSHAIQITQPVTYPDLAVRILQNNIAQFEQGISISSCQYSMISGNYVNMDFIISGLSNPVFGIRCENSNYTRINLNTLRGTSNPNYCDTNVFGMHVDNSIETGIYCNDFGDPNLPLGTPEFTFHRNLFLQNAVDYSGVAGNSFRREHLHSFYMLDAPSGIGQQGYNFKASDNEWFLASNSNACGTTTQDIFSEDSHTNLMVTPTLFYTRSLAPHPHEQPFSIGVGFPVQNCAICSLPDPNNICEIFRFSDGELERSIAEGTAFNSNVPESYKWTSENWLHDVLPLYEEYASDAILMEAWDSYENGNYGAYKEITGQLKNAVSGTTISLTEFQASTSIEDNIYFILEIGAQIKKEGFSGLTIAQKQSLEELSLSCALVDGPAVYMARSYRSLIDNFVYNYPYDCETLSSGGNRMIASANKTQSLTLFHSNGELYLTSGTSDYYLLEIFDLTGKTVLSTELNTNDHVKTNLMPGIYAYKLSTKTGETRLIRDKIIIM